MKATPLLALTATLILVGCSEPKRVEPQASESPAESPSSRAPEPKELVSLKKEDPAPAAYTPPPDSANSPAIVPAAPTRPEKVGIGGSVFTVDRVSITTDDGIFSVPAGTKVRVLKHSAAGYVVTDEKREFEIAESQATLHAAAAVSAAQVEAASRSADVAWHRAQMEAVQQQQQRAAQADQAATAERRRRDLQSRMEALVKEEAALKASIRQAQIQESRAREARIFGRTYSKSISAGQESAWSVRLSVVQLEISRVQGELARP